MVREQHMQHAREQAALMLGNLSIVGPVRFTGDRLYGQSVTG